MTKEELAQAVCVRYEEWCGLGKDQRARSLKMHVFRFDRELFRALRREPGVLGQLPPAVLAVWALDRSRKVGLCTLEAFMPELVRRWLAERERGETRSFEAYCQALLAAHPTVRKLEAFLAS